MDTKEMKAVKAELEASQKTAADNLELANVAQSELQKTKEELAELKEQFTAVSEELEAIKGQAAGSQHAAELSSAKEQLTAAEAVIADLKSQLTTASAKETGKESFELDGTRYEILGAVNIPRRGKMTALEVATDPEAQAFLVRVSSGMIREIK